MTKEKFYYAAKRQAKNVESFSDIRKNNVKTMGYNCHEDSTKWSN